MDDSSATTEASGLTSDPDTTETLTPARPAASDETLLRVAERLRRAATAAPLPSLFAAFAFGIWVGRRL